VQPRRLRSAVTYASAILVVMAPTALLALPWLIPS
jgi:hypothetical protein